MSIDRQEVERILCDIEALEARSAPLEERAAQARNAANTAWRTYLLTKQEADQATREAQAFQDEFASLRGQLVATISDAGSDFPADEEGEEEDN